MRLISALFIFFVYFLFSAFSVSADEKGTVTIYPAVFDITLSEGEEEKTIVITLENASEEEVSLELFSINFTQADEYGRIGFVGQDASQYSYALSSYIRLPTNSLQLEAFEKREIEVVIENRTDLSSGGHYAAVVARSTVEGDKTTVSPAVSSLILLRKTGGEIFNLSIRDVDWPSQLVVFDHPQKISLLFQNQGNVHLTPFGRVEITDSFGRIVSKGVLNTSSARIFPLSRRYIYADLEPVSLQLPISIHTISVRGNDSLEKTSYIHQDTYLYVHPAFIALAVLLIIFRVYIRYEKIQIGSLIRRRKR